MKKLLALLVVWTMSSSVTQAQEELITAEKYPEHYCMALNIYYEARGSNLADKAAVSDVVLNRVEDTRYPDTICEVVYQGKQDSKGNMIRNACQFSWYCDGKADNPQDDDRWFEAQMIAWGIMEYGISP